MRWKPLILVLIIIIAGNFVWFHPQTVYRLFHPAGNQQVIQYVFKNQQIFDTMASAQLVTAQRLHQRNDGNQELLSGYDQGTVVTLTADQAENVKDLLQSPWSYAWDTVKSGMPDYGVLFRFQSAGGTVRVAFCFSCRQVGVFDGDDDSLKLVNSNSNFDPMRAQMVSLLKEIFPNDKEIQALQ